MCSLPELNVLSIPTPGTKTDSHPGSVGTPKMGTQETHLNKRSEI